MSEIFDNGVRFCTLYRQDRTPREEAEFNRLFKWAYEEAFGVVSYIARKAGLSDIDMLSDSATTLLDFCARSYDCEGKKTLFAFFRNIAHAYLLKHRDFLSFSKRLTQVGYESTDYLTRQMYGAPDETCSKPIHASPEAECQDVFVNLSEDNLDPLYAAEWGNNGHLYDEDPEPEGEDDDLYSAATAEPVSLSTWVERTIAYIDVADIPPPTLARRAQQIVDQLQDVSGSPIADIAKRLMTRAGSGCSISRTLLFAMASFLDPKRHEKTVEKIRPFLLASPAETMDLGLQIDTGDLLHGRVPARKPVAPMREDETLGQKDDVAEKRRQRRPAKKSAAFVPSVQIDLQLGLAS